VESGKNTTVVLWTSVAVAAGIITFAAITNWPRRGLKVLSKTPIRDAQEVLADCYKKIREIEEHLPTVLASTASKPVRQKRTQVRSISNGNPVLDS